MTAFTDSSPFFSFLSYFDRSPQWSYLSITEINFEVSSAAISFNSQFFPVSAMRFHVLAARLFHRVYSVLETNAAWIVLIVGVMAAVSLILSTKQSFFVFCLIALYPRVQIKISFISVFNDGSFLW